MIIVKQNHLISSVFTKENDSPLPQLPNSYLSIDPVVISTEGVANFTFRSMHAKLAVQIIFQLEL